MAMITRLLRTITPVIVASAVLCALPFTSLSAQTTSSLVTTRITQPIDNNSVVTLKGMVHPLANAANDRGAAPESMQLDRLQVVFKRSAAQEAALQQLIQEQNVPGSPSYHKWLTPAQFGAEFGPSDQDVATIKSWLESQGFNIGSVESGKQVLDVSGSVAQFSNAFHTQIHKYEVNGETHYANATNPKIPAALAPVFGGFVSLNNFRIKSQARYLGKATYDPKTGQSTPQWTYGNSSGIALLLAPADFALQYDLPSTITGTGQTIAIINDSNINVALVNQFRTLFGLPANPPQVIVDGNDPGVDGINNPDGPNYDSVEAYLDTEWSGAVAPNATIDLVVSGDTALESGLILAAEHAVYSNVAPVISLSFGACEQSLGSFNAYLNDLWEQAAAQGITVMVSTGDSGSAGCDSPSQYYATGGLAVNGFGSTPYNVAVGGTDFYYASGSSSIGNYWNTTPSQNPALSLKTRVPEQPWNDSQYGSNIIDYYNTISGGTATTIAGGGGGASSCETGTPITGSYSTCTGGYLKPAWQTGPGVPSDNVRDVPDVSLFAADGLNGSYYPICAGDGDCQPASGTNLMQISGVGGTSASSPAFAAIMALVNQQYGRQGQADTILYPLAKQYPAAFHDVTAGTNAEPCAYSSASSNSPNCTSVSNPITVTDPNLGAATEGELSGYSAGVGYDRATGLGSVDASVLISDWNKVTLSTTSVSLTPSQASFAHGTAITINGTVTGTGTPTGNVALMTDSPLLNSQGVGLSTWFNAGQSTFKLNSSGAYTGSVNSLPGGTYDIWGQYGGDSNYAAGTSAKTQVTVTPEASGIYFNALTPSSSSGYSTNPSGSAFAYGTQILLSGLVAPSSQLTAYENCISGTATTCPSFEFPTGTVTFSDSGTAINTAVINSEGEAEYAPPAAFSIGSHSVTAGYSGDSSYNASSASAITFTVAKATPTIFLTTANATVNAGQSITLTVLVESNGVGLAPTGSVTISGGPSGTPTSATLSPTVDPFHNTTAGVATITIPASATAARATMPAPLNHSDGWLAGGGAALACILLFGIPARDRRWRNMLGLIVIALVTATFGIGCGSGSGSNSGFGGGTTKGTYTINVIYSGDSNYNTVTGSTSITISAASTLQTSTTSVTSTSTAPTTTAAVGVSVSVAGVSGHAAPTGTVVLYSGSLSPSNSSQPINVEITQGTLTAGSGTSATAAFTLNSEQLLQGANLLTVLYEGDTVYAPSSTTINLNNPLSDFSMVPSNSIVSLASTGSATDILNLQAMSGFNGTVALTCKTPTGISTLSCLLTPTSVSLPGTGMAATSQLTVTGAATTPGNYQVLITGTDSTGGTVHTVAVTVAVK
jgi:subtilase family serine protease